MYSGVAFCQHQIAQQWPGIQCPQQRGQGGKNGSGKSHPRGLRHSQNTCISVCYPSSHRGRRGTKGQDRGREGLRPQRLWS